VVGNHVPTAQLNEIDLAYEARGTGPIVLFVAGTGYPGATWLPDIVDRLTPDYTVVTFDHRGTGATLGTPGTYSTRQFAADALGLLQALDAGPAHVIGHSMGGRVAQWMALDGPSQVQSLVLAATGPGQIRDDFPLMRGIPLNTALSLIEHGYERRMQKAIRESFFTPEFAAANPDVVQSLVSAFWDNRPSLENYLKHVIARQQHQTAELVDRITMPALVLIGDRDTGIGGTGSHVEQSEYLASHLPNAEMRVIPDTAHGYFWQKPEETMTAIRVFLAEQR
jgi:pimeloyl-ACP methyl ester carboxylesterase